MTALRDAARQNQFLDVVSRDAAERLFRQHLAMRPLGEEHVALLAARGRVLSRDVAAPVDVPGFDRASVDGFAVRAADCAGATRDRPALLRLNAEVLTPGVLPAITVAAGTATVIATGGMLPRGADAVVMIEQTDVSDADPPTVAIGRAPVAGQAVAGAGSDMARGDTVLRQGCVLTSRELGMIAAVGLAEVPVWRRPRVAVFSTGDEIVAPGAAIRAGQVFDSNATILAAAVAEQGGEPIPLGIVADDPAALSAMLAHAIAVADVVLLSGGTSKGAGDLAHQAVSHLTDPGVVVHGVALKPGKPLCLAVTQGKPVAVLPGFPTSAIFTFHAFLAPVIRAMAGLPPEAPATVAARLPLPVASERGRMECVLVSLLQDAAGGLAAYPTAKGSGAVTSFAQADGFFAVPAATEAVAAGTTVQVQRIGVAARAADLVLIGSNCTGLDLVTGVLEREGLLVKVLSVGSMGGLMAARRGECDLAPIHLMEPESGRYNTPFVGDGLTLVPGYGRLQGVVFRPDDARFAACDTAAAAIDAGSLPGVLMVNRNPGSGTRILTDRLLGGARPDGFGYQVKSHNAVAAAVAQSRADWGVAIATVARAYGLGFLPLQPEQYDFAVPNARLARPAVQRFIAVLNSPAVRTALRDAGFTA